MVITDQTANATYETVFWSLTEFFVMTEKNYINLVKKCPKTKDHRMCSSYFRQMIELSQSKKNR